MKRCGKCGRSKPMSEFSRNKNRKDGINLWCRMCAAEYRREWYKANPNYNREWGKANREKKSAYNRKWLNANREKKAKCDQEYRKANREKIAEYHREYQRKHIAEDVQFKLARNLRNRLYYAIKGKAKNGSAVRDLGCTLEELKLHLESLFAKGMTWDNYGRWHIDHVLPLSSFDLTDRKQLLDACHYTNLQPLWAEDNFRKHDKLPEDIN